MNTTYGPKLCPPILSIALLFSFLNGQPANKDYYRTAAEVGVFLFLEYGYTGESPSLETSTEAPNSFDQFFRNKLRWDLDEIDNAKTASDILLYGLFLGGIPFTPLISDGDYKTMVLANVEIMAINGLVTNLVKHTVDRKRPSSYYQTRDEGGDTYKSFFSGHTSQAFSIGTSTAIMLSRSHPDKKYLIWGSAITLAATTGYFRIAADKHYMTDVLSGALVGSIIGFWVQKKHAKTYFSIGVDPASTHYQVIWYF